MKRRWQEKCEGRGKAKRNSTSDKKVVEELGGTMETAIQQLMAQYGLEKTEAQEKVKLFWQGEKEQ